jgi:hypothetical protein
MSFTARVRLIATLVGLTTAAGSQVASAQQIQTQAPTRELRGLSVSLVMTSGRRFGDGYRLFDRDGGEGGGGGEVTLDVLSLGGSGKLAVGLGIQGESDESSTPGLVSLEALGGYATVIARFRTAATWQPYAGLAAGLERGSLSLNPSGRESLTSKAWGAFGRASLGVRFAPRRLTLKTQAGDSVLAVALALEAAGTVGTSLGFEYRAEPPSQGAGDSDRIPTGTVPLGNMSRQAVQGRGLISVIF